jgi:hypothetical protein
VLPFCLGLPMMQIAFMTLHFASGFRCLGQRLETIMSSIASPGYLSPSCLSYADSKLI